MQTRRVIELVVCACSFCFLGFFIGWGLRKGDGLDLAPPNLTPSPLNHKPIGSSSLSKPNPQDFFDEGGTPHSRAKHPRPLFGAQSLLAEIKRIQQIQGSGGLREHVNLLDRLAVSDTRKIAKDLLAEPPTGLLQQALYLVLDAMAWRNPTAAWEFATGLPADCSHREAAITSVLAALTQKDPEEALQLIQSLDDNLLAGRLRKIAILQTAANNPKLAFRWLNPQEQADSGLLGTIFSHWAKVNPKEAIDATSRLPNEAYQIALSTILSTIADSDPVSAWHQAQKFVPTIPEQFDPRVPIIQAWTRQDAAAAASAAVGIAQQNIKRTAIMAAVTTWADQDFRGAFEFAKSLQDPDAKSDALVALAKKAQPSNHNALLEEILEHVKPGESYQRAITTLFSNWAAESPENAAQAIRQLPPGRLLSTTASLVASNWASRQAGSPQILLWALSLPQGEARNRSVAAIMQNWASKNPSEAASAASLLEGRERLTAISQIAEKWAQAQPREAFDWASRLTNQEEHQEILGQILSTWAIKDPPQALQLALKFDGQNDAALTRSAFSAWASHDLEGAAKWASSLPAGPKKDTTLRCLAEQIAYEDPAMAIHWATSINNPKLRERSISRLAREWLRHDTANAKAWLATAPISEETRQRILRR